MKKQLECHWQLDIVKTFKESGLTVKFERHSDRKILIAIVNGKNVGMFDSNKHQGFVY
jgi:hypothetical protein